MGIAQEIAGLPLFSGIEYRLVIWLVVNIVGIGYVLRYAAKVKKTPKKSIVYEEDEYWRLHHSQATEIISQPSLSKTWITYFLVLLASVVYAIMMPMNSIKVGPSVLHMPLLPILSILFAFFGYITAKKINAIFCVEPFVVYHCLSDGRCNGF